MANVVLTKNNKKTQVDDLQKLDKEVINMQL